MRQYEDLLIDVLLDSGFTVEEAVRLIALQERAERERWQTWEQRTRFWFQGEELWTPRDRLN
ncbi:MAG TPA: hypothetical protein VIG30_17670 [Ktedonobacterales bacterium]|jgi:hypothetical protein